MFIRISIDVAEGGTIIGAYYEIRDNDAYVRKVHVCSLNDVAELGLLDGLSEMWELACRREGILLFP